MNVARLLLPVLLGLALGLHPAWAEEEPPPFGASDLVLEDEGLAEGWEIVYEEVPGTPGDALGEWVVQVATSCGLEEDAIFTEIRILKGPDDAGATIAVVETDGDPKSFPSTLEQRGKGLHYAVRTLGHPTRLLVVAAPEAHREAVEAMQVEYAVSILSRLGFERLTAGSQLGAIAFARGAREIDKRAGAPLVVLGMAAAKLEKWDEAVEAFRAGFADGVTIPAEGRVAMRGNAFFGYALLKLTDQPSPEAVKVLERAVALEEHAEREDTTFATRQNLARAYVRTGQLDKAFAMLEKALEQGKIHLGGEGLRRWIEAQVVTADEWKKLLDDDRFKGVIERVTGASIDDDDEGL